MKRNDPTSLIHAESFLLKNSNEKDIAKISYFFGELIICNLKGKWDIDEFGVPILSHIGGKEGMKKNPYKIVSRFIVNPQLNDLIGHYNSIKFDKLHMIECRVIALIEIFTNLIYKNKRLV